MGKGINSSVYNCFNGNQKDIKLYREYNTFRGRLFAKKQHFARINKRKPTENEIKMMKEDLNWSDEGKFQYNKYRVFCCKRALGKVNLSRDKQNSCYVRQNAEEKDVRCDPESPLSSMDIVQSIIADSELDLTLYTNCSDSQYIQICDTKKECDAKTYTELIDVATGTGITF